MNKDVKTVALVVLGVMVAGAIMGQFGTAPVVSTARSGYR